MREAMVGLFSAAEELLEEIAMDRRLVSQTLLVALELLGSTQRFAESLIPADECHLGQLSAIREAL